MVVSVWVVAAESEEDSVLELEEDSVLELEEALE
jgi:hypothetical protein